eukprot:4853289-Pleurochrysis_carterae.AAC.2
MHGISHSALVHSIRRLLNHHGPVPTGWPGSFFKSTWNSITNLALTVEGVVNTVTGTLDGDKDFSQNILSWNYDKGARGSKGEVPLGSQGRVKCNGCYANVNLGIYVNLDIASYQVRRLEEYVEGDVHIELGVSIDCAQKASLIKNYIVLDTLRLPRITFFIGPAPVVIDMSMPIHAGFEVDEETMGTLELSTGAYIQGKRGYVYTPSDGLSLIHKVENNVHKSLDKIPDAKLKLTLYLQPVLVMIVEYIGGPKLILWQVPTGESRQPLAHTLTYMWQIRHTIFEKDFESKSNYSVKKVIATGCLPSIDERTVDSIHSFDAIGPVCKQPHGQAPACTEFIGLQNDGTVLGTTWNGTSTKFHSVEKCSGYPELQSLSCQITEFDFAGDLTFI